MVNHFTKWLVAVPLTNRRSPTLIRAIDDNWFSEGYAFSEVYADRAPELWTDEFKNLLSRYGSSFIPGPPHHSETQGHIERINRTVQDTIAKGLEGSEHQWSRFLKPVIYAYRLTVHTATGFTPFFLTHGWEPLPPLLNALLPPPAPSDELHAYIENLRHNIQESWAATHKQLCKYHSSAAAKLNLNRKPLTLPIDLLVYIRLPPSKGQSQGLQSFTSGLWKLLSYDKRSNKCTVVTNADGVTRQEDVHAQYVLPFTGTLSFKPALDYTFVTPKSTIPKANLQPHPHQPVPRHRGRPRRNRRTTA